MNASDLVTAALEKRPSDFFKIFNELALKRAEALVGEMKDDIARGLVTSSEATDEEFAENAVVDTRKHSMMRDASRPFAVVSKDGKKVLSRHPTEELANRAAKRRKVSEEFDEEIEAFLEHLSTLTEEEVEEELEQLDEISYKKISSYVDKNIEHTNKAARDRNNGVVADVDKRRRGSELAIKKIFGDARVNATFEEVEPIDELSKTSLGNYIKIAKGVKASADQSAGYWSGQDSRDARPHERRMGKLASKRSKGIDRAVNKLVGSARVNASEEVEPIDEISSKNINRYLSASLSRGHEPIISKERYPDQRPEVLGKTRIKRSASMRLAHRKLDGLARVNASEEVEPIDELSRKTLGSYVKKAVDDLRFQDRDNAITLSRLDFRPDDNLKKARAKAHKRADSINRAADKLAKEETLNLGGYQPVPGAEKDFVSKHKVEKFGDRAGNGDAVYKGTTKPAKYPKADKGGTVASTE